MDKSINLDVMIPGHANPSLLHRLAGACSGRSLAHPTSYALALHFLSTSWSTDATQPLSRYFAEVLTQDLMKSQLQQLVAQSVVESPKRDRVQQALEVWARHCGLDQSHGKDSPWLTHAASARESVLTILALPDALLRALCRELESLLDQGHRQEPSSLLYATTSGDTPTSGSYAVLPFYKPAAPVNTGVRAPGPLLPDLRAGASRLGQFITLYEAQAAEHAVSRQRGGRGDQDNAKQANILARMAEESPHRRLQQIKEPHGLAPLYARFPHFSDVLSFMETHLALAATGEPARPISMPPILLRGAPGTGKTYFTEEVARALGLPYVSRDLSVTTEAFVLSGADATWKNSKPGLVFDTLFNGDVANPLICLDEVDKALAGDSKNSPIAALYALLEPGSARRFNDEFVPISIDASHVIWLLTANDGFIPEPIESRLEVFEIPPPTPEQCMQIAASVWESLARTFLPSGHGFDMQLDEDVAHLMSRMNPRAMRKALLFAAGLAARRGSRRLDAAVVEQAIGRYEPPSRTMGFLA